MKTIYDIYEDYRIVGSRLDVDKIEREEPESMEWLDELIEAWMELVGKEV